jgi:hypothetical protein
MSELDIDKTLLIVEARLNALDGKYVKYKDSISEMGAMLLVVIHVLQQMRRERP